MEDYLRAWRRDALDRHQYDTAIFIGDKLLALTSECNIHSRERFLTRVDSDEDHYALAQTHFSASNYTRALAYLSKANLIDRSPAAKYLAAHCYIQQSKHEEALSILGDKDPEQLISAADSARKKYLNVGTAKQHGKSKAPTGRIDRSEERDRENSAHFKHEAGMCYLRGLCYAKQNAFDKAKRCYQNAVKIDVQCFEAFDQLMKNALMSPEEEWRFLNELNFDSLDPATGSRQEAADFTKNLYITRMSKYAKVDEFTAAIETLSTHYRLSENPDILLAKAGMLFTSARYESALHLTSAILDSDPYNFPCLPLHLALLYQLNDNSSLFALSHNLADTHPNEPCTWLAVGTYYLSTNRIPEARSYFSKASLMDPHFGPAWIGFAHTFAAEGEGDQAIAAYSTAARLFQGTHLPQMFLGMQEIALDNLVIAREYLTAAFKLCSQDPLLINEIGVVAYKEQEYDSAARHFKYALNLAEGNGAPLSQYSTTRLNLAHALRQTGHYQEALEQFDEVIRSGLREASVFTAKGLVLLELSQPFDAVVALHEALAVSPQDPMASDLLNRALESFKAENFMGNAEESAIDANLQSRLIEAKKRKRKARRGDDDMMDLDGQGQS